MSARDFGELEGDVCHRNGCKGVISLKDIDGGCSCHINPPCGYCMTPREYCPVCEWDSEEEQRAEYLNGFRCIQSTADRNVWSSWKPRPLDPRKIDWHAKPHTHSSMIKEGVYPEGTTRAEVEALVKGTFGGRFESFGNGRFKYVAHTD